MINIDLKQAISHLEKHGIGTGTNITKNLTAGLMVDFAKDQFYPLLNDFIEWLFLQPASTLNQRTDIVINDYLHKECKCKVKPTA